MYLTRPLPHHAQVYLELVTFAILQDSYDYTDFGKGLDYNSSSELSDIAEVDEEPEGEIEAPQPTGGQTGPAGAPSSGTKVN